MRARPKVIAIAASLALLASVAPAVAGASGDLWVTLAADPVGYHPEIALGPDGVHHLAAVNVNDNGSVYATDRGNHWTRSDLSGSLADLTVDADGHVYILTTGFYLGWAQAAQLTTDVTGELLTTTIPGTNGTNLGAIEVEGNGTVHVALGYRDGTSVAYLTRVSGTWSAADTLSLIPSARAITMVVDAAGVAHVVASGQLGQFDPHPAGCPGSQCTVEVVTGDTAVTTGIADHLYLYLDSVIGDAGTIDIAGSDGDSVDHVGNAGGSWAAEEVDAVTAAHLGISLGPDGPVMFYADVNGPDAAYRADWTGSAWAITTIDGVANGDVVGVVDAANRPHVATLFAYNDPEGGVLTALLLVAPDDIKPVASVPQVSVKRGGVVGSTVPVRVAWSAADALSGVASYAVGQKTGSTWSTISSSTTTRSVTRNLAPGTSYAFRVRARDLDGNVGDYAETPTLKLSRHPETSALVTYGGTWRRSSSTRHLGGAAKYATSTRASATVTVTGTGFAWIGTYGPTRGSADIWVDGELVERVKTYRASTTYRVAIWSIRWDGSGTHTIRIKPAGTSGHPRVDIDGFVVIR